MAENKTIRYYLATNSLEYDKKRVAVYARVSREGELKHISIEAQKNNLRDAVNQHPGWEFMDFYVDEGVTGTKMNRPEFNRMMHDAREGKIDIIYTKSVSRFGRNLSAVLVKLHELKSLGVEVIFDSDHISTNNPTALLTLQFNAIQAEATAKQASDYQKWSIRNRFRDGIPNNMRLYGYRMEDHKLIVIPEEAAIVRRIFMMYLSGMGMIAISKALNKEGVPKYSGEKWIDSNIRKILRNEKYAGDMLLQKEYVADYLTKKEKINHGELPQYYVEDAHEPIIDREMFNQVQTEMKRRAELYSGKANTGRRGHRLFSQLLYCGHCHKTMNYKEWISHQYRRAVWVCPDYLRLGGEHCPVYSVREDTLIQVTSEVLQEAGLIKKGTALTNELLKKHIAYINANENHLLEYHLLSGDVITKTWQYESRKKSWTPEMREKARERAFIQNANAKASYIMMDNCSMKGGTYAK